MVFGLETEVRMHQRESKLIQFQRVLELMHTALGLSQEIEPRSTDYEAG